MLSDRDPVLGPPLPGGTTDHLRRSNLSSVFGLVHRDGPLSRVDLTSLTGLNRSTIGDLVGELARLGLVYEAQPTTSTLPGRPSLVVHGHPDVVAIAVDPEVDAIHVGVVGLSGRVIARIRLETSRVPTPADVITISSAAIAGLLSAREPSSRVVGIGIAVPGQVRRSDGEVTEATHMGWDHEPLARMMTEATGLAAWAANGATLGMRAESVFGAGRGVDDFVYLIGGASGIGGGAVTGGRFLSGSAGFAGEFGHTFVRSGGARCACGASGCLEAEISQAAMLDAVGLAPSESHQLAARLVGNDDPQVQEFVLEKLELLGVALRNAVNLFNPSVVVLAGFLGVLCEAGIAAGASGLLDSAIRSSREGVRIVPAALGIEQLMVGAGELVFSELIADPTRFLVREGS